MDFILVQDKARQDKTIAFTLVELSIVIVIIGLIIAGVTAGSSLVQATKLRAITTEVDQFKAAINTFKLQYDALPGDLKIASSYWTGVQNGNGNRVVDWSGEDLYAWRHLALAGLIPGVFSGSNAVNSRTIGGNIPESAFSSDAGYSYGREPNAAYSVPANSYHQIDLASSSQSCNTWLNGKLLSVKQAVAIDTKMDDGLADSGMVFGIRGDAPSGCSPVSALCVTGLYSASSSSYILSDTSNAPTCRMYFWVDRRK